MHIIWSLIVGLVVGAIAKLIMPGKDPGGIIVTALLGIGGAMLAAFLGRSLGFYHAGDVGPGLIAPPIPSSAVTMMPPGSFPCMIGLADFTTTRPTINDQMMCMCALLSEEIGR